MTRFLRRSLTAAVVCIALVLISLLQTAYSQTSTSTSAPGQTTPGATTPDAVDEVDLRSLEPAEAVRGEAVTVIGAFPKKPVDISVELKSTDPGSSVKVTSTNVNIADDGQTFTFVVPRTIRLGRYDVIITFTKAGKKYEPAVAPVADGATFRVISGEPVKVDAVYPIVSYPERDSFGFKIIGEGFSPIKEDNALFIEGMGAVPICGSPRAGRQCVNQEIVDPGREIRFSGLPLADYKGVLNVRIRVGDEYAEKPIAVTLSQIGRKTPAIIAVIFVCGLTILVVLLVRRRAARTGGPRLGLLSTIFLDNETNTYSLSKLQFYAWTLAALFGYVYLSVSRSLVQGKIEFADIPENLPGILLVSVSTSALAVGITSARGSKGAGDIGPSGADFVTTGGVVAAERIQFLAWTLVGVGAFVFLTLSTEPGQIQDLPAVPERFLYLMGISSFGYLGGKMARKPGPVITQIEATLGSLILDIHGSNLSPDATFKIDDQDLNPKLLDDKAHPKGRPELVVNDDQPGFAKVLRLNIATPDDAWLTGDHDFTITNPDGQKAVLKFNAETAPAKKDGTV